MARHFRSDKGNLYEGSNSDVEDRLEQDAGNPSGNQADLRELAEACREPDLAKRWQLLNRCLDVEKFAAFAAIEVLICHRDGLSLDRNNFRIYHDPTTNNLVFIPHGMDLIFDNPTAPLESQFRGSVARALMEMPQGRQMYRRRLKEMGQLAYGTNWLSVRTSELDRQLRAAFMDEGRKRSFDSSVAQLHECLRARRAFVRKQIACMCGAVVGALLGAERWNLIVSKTASDQRKDWRSLLR
ncbi:MAG: CotH kinase family protein [Verrucomicrobiales bacterium]|nr:CotH kinase family protein [Verrucomicrobiales bacterium]